MKKDSCSKSGRALIVNPPVAVDRDFIDYPYFANLGAVQHASAIAAEGFDVVLADSFSFRGSGVEPLDDGRYLAGCLPEGFAGRRQFDAAVVCVSVFHRPFARDELLAGFFRRLRKMFPDMPVAAADMYFGGMHYVDYPGAVFLANYPEVDALLRYETEAASAKWLKGVRSGCAVVRGEITGAVVGKLDEMPFPAWDKVNVNDYLAFLRRFMDATGRLADFSEIMPVLPVVTSRGCLYSCSFCSGTDVPQSRRHRRISPGRLREYLAGLKREYGIAGIACLDGLANGDADDFTLMLEAVREAGLKVSFVNGLRADRLKKSHIKMLSTLSPSLTVSAESAPERIRNGVLKKGLKLDAVERAAAWSSEHGLPISIHYMIGAPGETVAEANATLGHARDMSERYGAEPLAQVCVPLPGSALHGRAVSGGGAVADTASDYSALFRGGTAGPDATDRAGRMLHNFRMRMRESEPEKLIINLTYRCNNLCGMCAVGGRPRRDMSFETCAGLLKEYALRGVTMLDLDGGEPTLHPDLLKIIALARALGYGRINVTTNGRKLASRDFTSRLLLGGITDLHISVYGPDAESHEGVTGVKGSFDETARGIRNAVRLRPERVGFCVNTVMTKSNYMRISELMEWVAGLGARALDVQFPTPFGAAREGCLPPFDEAVSAFEQAAGKFRGVLNLNLINLPPCRMPAGWPGARADAEKYGRHMAFVNAQPQSLGAYLASKRARAPGCIDCEYYIICEGFYVFD